IAGSIGGADSSDYLTAAYLTSTGERVWQARYAGPGRGDDRAADVALSPDGSTVFVTGESGAPEHGRGIATVAYDAGTGNELWSARYDGPPHSTDAGQALAVSPDGSRVYVVGDVSNSVIGTIEYDAATGA